MATYYVRKTGSDANAGTSAGAAKLTIQAAINVATTAGDTIYVGSGVYRETVTFGTSGTAGNVISLIGDYTGAFTGDAKGVVRITGSNDDISATRTNCITAASKNYIAVRGFVFDITTSHSVFLNDCTNWTVSGCYLGTTAAGNNYYADGASQANHIVENCFVDCSNNNGIQFQHGGAVNNAGHIVRNCIVTNQRYNGISLVRVGGVSVLNCVLMGGWSSQNGIIAFAFAGTQTACTVYNCVIMANNVGISAGATTDITENYNTIYACGTTRTNVTAGANSVTRPPLFDTRWFFEMVNGGRLVTPFDLASYSTLSEYSSGTGAPSTDLRGASVVGTYREWGALEYDSTLDIEAGSAGGVKTHPGMGGGING